MDSEEQEVTRILQRLLQMLSKGDKLAFEKLHRIARASTFMFETSLINPEFRSLLCSYANRIEGLPVMFDEKKDFSRYKEFRIGYDLIPSLDPRKRANPELDVFSGRALAIIELIDSFRACSDIAKRVAVEPCSLPIEIKYFSNSFYAMIPKNERRDASAYQETKDESEREAILSRLKQKTPSWVYDAAQLPPLSKATLPQWRPIAREAILAVFPKAFFEPNHQHHSIVEGFYKLIGEPHNETPGKMRSRVAHLIERGIESLTPLNESELMRNINDFKWNLILNKDFAGMRD